MKDGCLLSAGEVEDNRTGEAGAANQVKSVWKPFRVLLCGNPGVGYGEARK